MGTIVNAERKGQVAVACPGTCFNLTGYSITYSVNLDCASGCITALVDPGIYFTTSIDQGTCTGTMVQDILANVTSDSGDCDPIQITITLTVIITYDAGSGIWNVYASIFAAAGQTTCPNDPDFSFPQTDLFAETTDGFLATAGIGGFTFPFAEDIEWGGSTAQIQVQPPYGVCCISGIYGLAHSQSDCEGAGGTWLGPCIPSDPNPC